MAGFWRAAIPVLAGGMIVGAGALMMLPPGAEGPLFAHSRIPDPPALPCKKQAWPNADRNCVTWTAPRQQTAQVDRPKAGPQAPSKESAPSPDPAKRDAPASAAEIAPAENAGTERTPSSPRIASAPPIAAPEPSRSAPRPAPTALVPPAAENAAQSEPAQRLHSGRRERQETRGLGDRRAISVTSYGADGRRRTIVIRPTSPQDVYYYRRNLASMAVSAGRH